MIEFPQIFLFTALACEAKPLVAHFKLKKNMQYQTFAIYSKGRYCLTVTGIGKVQTAAAVAYTQALLAQQSNPILINIGIAGHRQLPLASIRLADKLSDADNGRSFYPPLIFSAPCPTATVTTVSSPDTHYRHDGLIDMEASAFYQAAVNFTGAEFIHCLKIVSDNEQAPPDNIKPNRVSELLTGALSTVERLIHELSVLQQLLGEQEPEGYQLLLARWRFSVSEQHRLLQLLKQYRLLNGAELTGDFASGKDLLRWLEQANQTLALSMVLHEAKK